MEDNMLPYEIISVVLDGAELVCGEKEEGKASRFYLVPKNVAQTVKIINAMLNTRATDPLLEKMAEALEKAIDNPCIDLDELQKAKQAMQEYRKRIK